MGIYVVKEGDTVYSIAQVQGIPQETLISDNQIPPPYRLAVGQALYIGDKSPAANRPPLYVFGYAYPMITLENLDNTLPYLTDMYIFSYGFTQDGELIPPFSPDDGMIERTLQYGVRPVLTLTPFGEDGVFNNNLVTIAVNNTEVRENLIQNLLEVMEEKGYQGIDVDFEYIKAEDREAYIEFVRRMTEVMNENGYEVSVALVPKTSGEQAGLLYEGVDYGRLGEVANRVFLMTYEWGYTYGPPMAVAPVDKVRKVLDYAVSEIPVEKISMGIPNYGYDWALPYERGVTKARLINNQEAVQLAIDKGAEIEFDEEAQSPFFRYWENGEEHIVWFEDARSYQAKFDLLKEYGFSGAGYWQLMNFFRPNWLLLEQMYETRKNGE